ncbi:MAG TPA: DUF47 family protein [Chloroflexota bacterium]|nr:DUF47 family protein [Chloroflexota bacterium]
MPFSLVPRERQFFVLFRDNAATMVESLQVLDSLLANTTGDYADEARRLRDLEHKADETTHKVNNELNRTFITPFDREDIYALASAIDDVVDLSEETADTIVLDGIHEITPEAQKMGKILLSIGHEVAEAIDKLEKQTDLHEYWVRIHELENEADAVTRSAIGALFQNGYDPIYVIKWKDVYALLEKTVDRAEDIAKILETISIKNA